MVEDKSSESEGDVGGGDRDNLGPIDGTGCEECERKREDQSCFPFKMKHPRFAERCVEEVEDCEEDDEGSGLAEKACKKIFQHGLSAIRYLLSTDCCWRRSRYRLRLMSKLQRKSTGI